MSAKSIQSNLNYLEPRWCTFILNCPPNDEGLLDDNIVERLQEVGQLWSPDLTRPELPDQDPQIETFILPVSASATSGDANHAIDGKNDRFDYSVWEFADDLPQSLTIDLGHVYEGVNILYYVPKYVPMVSPRKEGSIQSYRIEASLNGTEYAEIASGTWNGDAKMKVATFPPANVRYLRLEILSAVEGFAAVTEIAIGKGDPAKTTVSEAAGLAACVYLA